MKEEASEPNRNENTYYLDMFQEFRWRERIFSGILAFMAFSAYATMRFYEQSKHHYAVIFGIFIFLFWLCAFWWRDCSIVQWKNFIRQLQNENEVTENEM